MKSSAISRPRAVMEVVVKLPSMDSIDLEKIDPFFIDLLNLNKEYCIKFLMHFGLIANNVKCCGQLMTLIKQERTIDGFCFRCKYCRKYCSVRNGSFFERSHLTISQILKLLFYYSNDVYNQDFIIKVMKVTSKTVVDWKNFIRDIYTNHFLINSQKVGGPIMIVQIDESLICKRKYNVGRILANQDQWIVGGIDEAGNIFMEITTERNQETLEAIIRRNVEPNSIIWSDCWAGYRNIDSAGYFHEVVNHSIEFVSSEGVHTNRIESIWGACKRKLNPIRNKKPDLIQGYLSEYIFKKKFSENVFSETLNQIKLIYKFPN